MRKMRTSPLPLSKLPTYTSVARNDEFARLILRQISGLESIHILGSGVLDGLTIGGLSEARQLDIFTYDLDPSISMLIERIKRGEGVTLRQIAEVSKDRMRDLPNWSLLSPTAVNVARHKLTNEGNRVTMRDAKPSYTAFYGLAHRLSKGLTRRYLPLPQYYLDVPSEVHERITHRTIDVFELLKNGMLQDELLICAFNLFINLERHFTGEEMVELYRDIARSLHPKRGALSLTTDYRHINGSDETCLPYTQVSILQRLEQQAELFPIMGAMLHLYKRKDVYNWFNGTLGVLCTTDPSHLPFESREMVDILTTGITRFFTQHGLEKCVREREVMLDDFYQRIHDGKPIYGFVRTDPRRVLYIECEGGTKADKTNRREFFYVR